MTWFQWLAVLLVLGSLASISHTLMEIRDRLPPPPVADGGAP